MPKYVKIDILRKNFAFNDLDQFRIFLIKNECFSKQSKTKNCSPDC